jgi:hypothetical protein
VKVSTRISSYEWYCTEIITELNNIILVLMHGKREELQKFKDITLQSMGDSTHKDQFTLYVMTQTGNRPSSDQQFVLVIICSINTIPA